MDNRWVVPYNPYLTKKYKAHINVEVCSSIQAIKYVNKYVYKGSDCITLEIEDTQDEIKKHLHSSLQVHLPGEQAVYFPSEATASEITEILQRNKSTLMAIFNYNERNENGRQYLYQEFPQPFVFDERRKKWHPRQRGCTIGRMYHCSPIAGERCYLHLLLTSVCGPKSFEDIRTVNGILYPTFREACVVLHLIGDDREWDRCFAGARLFATGANLRQLFLTALLQGQLNNPLTLWERYCSDICDELANKFLSILGDDVAFQILNQA
ncbi:hypothetical protein RMATCC62417_08095 [Rhizopus microsporus]|nr:hypothetical protein RMATCC62417_08095 [Rhizopus microsporus]